MRNVIKRERVRVDGGGAESFAPTDEAASRQERGVRLIPLADDTVAVEFSCKCGEVSVFEIEFEGPAEES